MDHRRGKWACAILAAQHPDGTWGAGFHSMAQPTRAPLSTEQALRRLHTLGFTIADEPIRRIVDTMAACLRGDRKIDAYWERGIDWAIYEPLMLTAWIRRFDPENPDALALARRWATVAEAGFSTGKYDESAWNDAYEAEFRRKERHPQPIGFTALYHGMLLPGMLSPNAESATFASKETSYWLAGLEILAEYSCAREALSFAAAHLYLNIGTDGQWDLGAKANDKVYFPLSDSWRTEAARRADCTEHIRCFLDKIT